MFEERREITELPAQPANEPEEVVSWYVPPVREGQEVVSYYVQAKPLPGKPRQKEAPVKKKSRRGMWIFLICLAVIIGLVGAGVLISALGGDLGDVILPDNGDSDASSIIHLGDEVNTTIPVVKGDPAVRLQVEDTIDPALPLQELYARVNPSVVTVVSSDQKASGVGTGVIMTSDGYVITNAHVIDGAESCWLLMHNGLVLDAELVGYDAIEDLAVLKANGENLPAARFGNSDYVVVGDPAYAIGNPLGLELRGTLTEGIISAVNRDVEVDGRTMTLLQTTAALNNGNSGGPLINACGQVIGINVIKMTNNGEFEATVEGLGFALPISDMAFVVNDIIAHGYFRGTPTIGIMVVTYAGEDGSTYVLVDSVVEGGAAEEAGVQAGDVIVAADGAPVSVNNDLLAVRRNHSVGEQVVLTVRRGSQELDIAVTLHSDRD